MMYKVIKTFADLQDNGHIYALGDTFPRNGKKVSAERLTELASAKNKLKTPLIKEVETEEKAEKVKKTTKATKKA